MLYWPRGRHSTQTPSPSKAQTFHFFWGQEPTRSLLLQYVLVTPVWALITLMPLLGIKSVISWHLRCWDRNNLPEAKLVLSHGTRGILVYYGGERYGRHHDGGSVLQRLTLPGGYREQRHELGAGLPFQSLLLWPGSISQNLAPKCFLQSWEISPWTRHSNLILSGHLRFKP